MKKIVNPPFIELHFYFRNKQQSVVLIEILEYFASKNINVSNTVYVHKQILQNELYAGINDIEITSVEVDGINGLKQQLNANRIIEVLVENASGICKNKFERLTFISLPEIIQNEFHPIALFTEADLIFENPVDSSKSKNIKILKEKLIEISINYNSCYSSICTEFSMETPEELKLLGFKSTSFKNTFINSSFYGKNQMDEVEFILKESNTFYEKYESGLYYSTELAELVTQSIDSNKSERVSMNIAKILAFPIK